MSTSDQQRGVTPTSLGTDQRGAVMVMGIFMCCIIVGALWYVAGIGDAIVLRERSQEIADAGAFSGATLHARGMNLIVLLNLVMACILGIRVALKTIQLVLVVLGALFTALSWLIPPLGVLAPPCIQGARAMNTLIKQLKQPINEALKALSKAELGIYKVVPAAACAGAYEVQQKYEPLVELAVTSVNLKEAAFLPLKEGTADRLCYEAGKSVGVLITWALSKVPGLGGLRDGEAGEFFGDKLGKVSKTAGSYFCEIGSGTGTPNFNDLFGETAKESCDSQYKEKVDKYNKARTPWLAKCDEYKVKCTEGDDLRGFDESFSFMDEEDLAALKEPDKTKKRTELTTLQKERDAKRADMDGFNAEQCKKSEVNKMKKEFEESTKGSDNSTSSGQDMTPKMVIPKWYNGAPEYQLIGLGVGDSKRLLTRGPRGVRVGAINKKTREIDSPVTAGIAFAQSEFFYDCKGAWNSDDCNGNYELKDAEGAMWHFRWRARLRRYNSPHEIAKGIVLPPVTGAQIITASDMAQAMAKRISGVGNAGLRKDVADAIAAKPDDVILH
jgi:hypothetical protein